MNLPKKVWSQLGPVPIVLGKKLVPDEKQPDNFAFGMWDEEKRTISIDPTSCHATQVRTLFHEMTHVALEDAGLQHTLSESLVETLCDVFGSYYGGAALAGYLVVRVPPK